MLYFCMFCCISFQNFDVAKVVNEKGCLEATEEWIERNMILLATCTFIVLFFQVSNLYLFIFALHCYYYYLILFNIINCSLIIMVVFIILDTGYLLCAKFKSRYFCTKSQMALTIEDSHCRVVQSVLSHCMGAVFMFISTI